MVPFGGPVRTVNLRPYGACYDPLSGAANWLYGLGKCGIPHFRAVLVFFFIMIYKQIPGERAEWTTAEKGKERRKCVLVPVITPSHSV